MRKFALVGRKSIDGGRIFEGAQGLREAYQAANSSIANDVVVVQLLAGFRSMADDPPEEDSVSVVFYATEDRE